MTFSNENIQIKETLVLPNVIMDIEYKKYQTVNIKQIHEMNLDNNKEIKMLKYETTKANWMSYITDGSIILIIVIISMYLYFRCKPKILNLKMIQRDSNLKEGRVTYPTHDACEYAHKGSFTFT